MTRLTEKQVIAKLNKELNETMDERDKAIESVLSTQAELKIAKQEYNKYKKKMSIIIATIVVMVIGVWLYIGGETIGDIKHAVKIMKLQRANDAQRQHHEQIHGY